VTRSQSKQLAEASSNDAPSDPNAPKAEPPPDDFNLPEDGDWRPLDCGACHHGKGKRKAFNHENPRPAKRVLERIHSDVKIMIDRPSLGGAKYLLTFIDEYSRFATVYPIQKKSEVHAKWNEFKAQAERMHACTILEIRADNGGEYVSTEWKEALKKDGIRMIPTQPHSPQQNGIAESYNRVLFENVRCMKHQGKIRDDLWGELAPTACHLRNLTPMEKLNWKAPYEVWTDRDATPLIEGLRTIWSEAYVHIPKTKTRKGALAKRADGPFRLIGYDPVKTGSYRLWDETKERIVTSRDVTFNEYNHISEDAPDEADAEYVVDKILDKRVNDDGDDEFLVRWDGWDELTWEPRAHLEDDNGHSDAIEEFETLQTKLKDLVDIDDVLFLSHSGEEDYPTVAEAMRSDRRDDWILSRMKEMDAHDKNVTWIDVNQQHIPKDAKILGSKFVLRIKRNPDHSINKLKTRLVVLGNRQSPDTYSETYAPVVRFATLRAMLAIAAHFDMEIHQMDVVTAFLNGSMEDEPQDIYMRLPSDEHGNRGKVVLLKKALYGLKQAPRLWNDNLDRYLKSLGFVVCNFDSALYLKHEAGILVAAVAVYVDDLTICTQDMTWMKEFKSQMIARYAMEDLGELKYLLGIEIKRDREKKIITLSQGKYIDDICARFKQNGGRTYQTPLDPNVELRHSETDKDVDPKEYQRITGSLMYLMLGTRPDLAFAVSKLCQFNAKPQTHHRTQALRCLRYAMTTRNLKLVFGRAHGTFEGKLPLEGYSDADYASCRVSRRSTTGTLFYLLNSLIAWTSRRQHLTALSSCEAEYVALCDSAKELVWIRNLVSEISPGLADTTPTVVHEDNEAAIKLASNPIDHARSKHIDVRMHYVRDQVNTGVLELKWCPTQLMVADALTKQLPKPAFQRHRESMGLVPDDWTRNVYTLDE